MIGILRLVNTANTKVLDREEEFFQMRSAFRKYGSSAFAFDLFEVPEEYSWFPFVGTCGIGGIAYKKLHHTYIIIGDPLLDEADWQQAVAAFIRQCPRFSAIAAVFASRSFAQIALNTGGAALDAQTAISLNPQSWLPVGPRTAKIRQYLRKSERAGLQLLKLSKDDIENSKYKNQIENLISDWRSNALKRKGNAHNVNLWKESALKHYFVLADVKEPEKLHALLIARPLPKKQGFYLWSARSSECTTGSLEALIAMTIDYYRNQGVHYLTFGPLQELRPHTYLNNIGGTVFSRYVMNHIVPFQIKKRGFHHTVRFYKKFGFQPGEKNYNLLWPKNSWFRAYYSMSRWLCYES